MSPFRLGEDRRDDPHRHAEREPADDVRAREVSHPAFTEAYVGGKEVVIRTHLDRADKYGRWLAVIHFRDAAGAWADLNAELLRLGHAKEAPWR